jgi:hypothetical protein
MCVQAIININLKRFAIFCRNVQGVVLESLEEIVFVARTFLRAGRLVLAKLPIDFYRNGIFSKIRPEFFP